MILSSRRELQIVVVVRPHLTPGSLGVLVADGHVGTALDECDLSHARLVLGTENGVVEVGRVALQGEVDDGVVAFLAGADAVHDPGQGLELGLLFGGELALVGAVGVALVVAERQLAVRVVGRVGADGSGGVEEGDPLPCGLAAVLVALLGVHHGSDPGEATEDQVETQMSRPELLGVPRRVQDRRLDRVLGGEVVDLVHVDLVGAAVEHRQVGDSGVAVEAGHLDLPLGVTILGVHQGRLLPVNHLVAVALGGEGGLVRRLTPVAPPSEHRLDVVVGVDAVDPGRGLVDRVGGDLAALRVDHDQLVRDGALEVVRELVERCGPVRLPVVVDLEGPVDEAGTAVAVRPDVALQVAPERAAERVLDAVVLLLRVLTTNGSRLARVLGVHDREAGRGAVDLAVVPVAVRAQRAQPVHVPVHDLQRVVAVHVAGTEVPRVARRQRAAADLLRDLLRNHHDVVRIGRRVLALLLDVDHDALGLCGRARLVPGASGELDDAVEHHAAEGGDHDPRADGRPVVAAGGEADDDDGDQPLDGPHPPVLVEGHPREADGRPHEEVQGPVQDEQDHAGASSCEERAFEVLGADGTEDGRHTCDQQGRDERQSDERHGSPYGR